MIFLDLEDLLRIAQRVIGPGVAVRDYGLLDSAVVRPRTAVFGQDAYVTIHEKAAALVHSVVSNHGLIDGKKRLGLAAVVVFYGVNGARLVMSNDEAYDFIMAVASGDLSEIAEIAEILRSKARPTTGE